MDETALVLPWALDVHVAFLAPRTPAHSGTPSVTRGLQAPSSLPLSQLVAEPRWLLLLNMLYMLGRWFLFQRGLGCALEYLGGEVAGKLGSSEQPRSSLLVVDRHLHHHPNTSLFLVQSWGGSLLPGIVGQWNLIKHETPTMATKILAIVDFWGPWLTQPSREPQGSPLLPEPPELLSCFRAFALGD